MRLVSMKKYCKNKKKIWKNKKRKNLSMNK